MSRLLKNLERALTNVLMVMMAVVVVVSVVDLGRSLILDMFSPPAVLLTVDETLKAHVHGPEVRAEVIVLVALAITFHIIRRSHEREPEPPREA